MPEKPPQSDWDDQLSGIFRACAVALIGGLLIGVIGAAFRAGLSWLGARHLEFVEWAHSWPSLGWVFPIVLGAAGAAIARLMVRPHPLAAGSGVQHVEAIMRDEAQPGSLWIVPIKFFGGLLAIGSGLALGREGPTIQMGATIGTELARRLRCVRDVMRDVQAALGGAGLAVAFNAPVGGALFVFEEVARSFRLRLVLVTLIGSGTAIAVMRMILGSTSDFHVQPLDAGSPWALGAYLILGCLLGLLGVLYNKIIILGLDTFARLKQWPVEVRAGVVGAIVGLVAWFFPRFVGGGDGISQEILNGGMALGPLLLILLVRWVIGPLSYSAGTPGGLFSPLLLVGACLGAIFAGTLNTVIPAPHALSAIAFAIVGMTAFFTGVVRAPITGIVLIAEMTATTALMVPMLVACFGAMLTASLVRGEPIYDTLRHRMLQSFNRI